MRRLSLLACWVAVVGCGGKQGEAPGVAARDASGRSAKREPAPKPAGPRAEAPGIAAAPSPAAPSPAAPAAGAAPSPTDPPPPVAAPPADAGPRVDPGWFRKTMFPDAASVDFKRSQVDDNGLFSSQLLFDLKEGSSVEDCVKVLQTEVGSKMQVNRTEAGGRITFKGTTPRFDVVMICGEAKGVVKAYVSYQWTR